MHWTLKSYAFLLAFVLSSGSAFVAKAEFPDSVITIIFPFSAGSGGDVGLRIYAEALGKRLGQPVIVQNKPGGNSAVAAAEALAAQRDGYTLTVLTSANAIAHADMRAQKKKLGYSIDDFNPLSGFAEFFNVIAVPANSPFKTLGDLLNYAKANPCTLNIGTSTYNSANNLVAKLLAHDAGVKYTIVTHTQTGDLTTNTMQGRVHAGIQLYTVFEGQFQAGTLRPLAVVTAKRSAYLPNVPAVSEMVPNYAVPSWMALYVPGGVPKGRAALLAKASREVLMDPLVTARLKEIGFEPLATQPEEQDSLMRGEMKKWDNFFTERADNQEKVCDGM